MVADSVPLLAITRRPDQQACPAQTHDIIEHGLITGIEMKTLGNNHEFPAFSLLGVALCVAILFGCAKSSYQLDSQVFVVTRGAGNYKLGLVTVTAFRRSDIDPLIAATQMQIDEARQKLIPEIQDAENRFKVASDYSDRLQATVRTNTSQVEEAGQKYNSDVGNAAQLQAKVSEEASQVDEAEQKFKDDTGNADQLQVKVNDDASKVEEARQKYNDDADTANRLIARQNDNDTDTSSADDAVAVAHADKDEYDRLREARDNDQQLADDAVAVVRADKAECDRLNKMRSDDQKLADDAAATAQADKTDLDRLDNQQLVDSAIAAARADKDEVDRLRALEDSSESGLVESFFAALPPNKIADAKTDADGRFSMTLPADQAAALIAEATRTVGNEIEHYYWVVPVQASAKADATPLLLSNDNLTSGGGSLIHTSNSID